MVIRSIESFKERVKIGDLVLIHGKLLHKDRLETIIQPGFLIEYSISEKIKDWKQAVLDSVRSDSIFSPFYLYYEHNKMTLKETGNSVLYLVNVTGYEVLRRAKNSR